MNDAKSNKCPCEKNKFESYLVLCTKKNEF